MNDKEARFIVESMMNGNKVRGVEEIPQSIIDDSLMWKEEEILLS